MPGALPLTSTTNGDTSRPAQVSPFDSTREYVSDNVLLFWKPPSVFSHWTPSAFEVLGVRYVCGEQYLMSEKAKLFGDQVSYKRIMASTDPSIHKSLGRGVRPFDHARWELRREDIVLTGNYAKFAQNAPMLKHLLATGNRTLAEASPLDTLWGIGFPASHPHAAHPSKWNGQNLLGKALMQVRRLLQDQPTAATTPASSNFPALSSSASSSTVSPSTSTPTRHSIFEVNGPDSSAPTTTTSEHVCGPLDDAPDDQPFDVLHIASSSTTARNDLIPEQGPDLVGGTLLMDSDSYTTRIRLHGGPTASSSLLTTALLDTGSPVSFVSDSVVDSMIAGGALSANCVRHSTARSWGGFGDGPALETTKSVRLTVKFLNGPSTTASLAVWACVVPTAAMGHPVLLGRDSWMRFDTRVFHTLPAKGPGGRVMGELSLSTRFKPGACAYATHSAAARPSFHLRYAGKEPISLSEESTLVDVNLVRYSGLPALVGEYLISFLPRVGQLSSPDAFVSDGLQRIPLSGCADLQPGALIGVASAPLLRVPFHAMSPAPASSSLSGRVHALADNSTAPAPNSNSPAPDCKSPAFADPDPASSTVLPKPPPTELLDRLTEAQRESFNRLWKRLPPQLHDVVFDLHDPEWSPEAIDHLADALCEYADVFSRSKTDFGECTVMPFTLSVPPGTKPVASRPYRINPLMQKKVDAVLDQYLAAGLIQHSTSPWASPLVIIPKNDGSVRITVNYKRLNALIDLDGQPLPRVDGILDSLYKGKIFSIFDLNSAFHQIVTDPDTVPLTAFCTPTQLFEFLRMPQGANASPSWFVKVINKVVHGLDRVLAYLDDVICFDEDPISHVANIVAFFQRLRQYNLKLSPGKARIGATHANFLGHTISPAGVSPDGDKVRALTHMPYPTNVKQLRSLLGGLSYYRKFLKNLATQVRPLNALLKQGVKFNYTADMATIVTSLLQDLSQPPVLVFPDWDAVEDNSRPLLLCSDACIDGFGASLEQEQLDGSVRPIVYISRSTLPSERNWTVLDLEAGGIVWAIKRLRGYLWSTKFIIYSDHKALESIGKVGEHNPRVQRWLEYLSNFKYTLKYRKGSANGNADFLSRLPLPATDADTTGPDRLVDVEAAGVFLVRARTQLYRSSNAPTIGLGGLVLGGLRPPVSAGVFDPPALTPADFGDFRRHGPSMINASRPDNSTSQDPSPIPRVLAITAAATTGAAVDWPPSASALAQPTVLPSPAPGAHLPSSPTPLDPLISSRTRARTAAASGTPRTQPSYFQQQPRATIAPRPPPSTRRPRTPTPTPTSPHLPDIPSTFSAQLPAPAPPRPTPASPYTPDTSTSPTFSAQPSTPAPLSNSLAQPSPPAPLPNFPAQLSPPAPLFNPSARPPPLVPPPASPSPSTSTNVQTALPPTHTNTVIDDSHLRDCVQSFTRTDWAAEQRRDTNCAAAIRYHSLGLPPDPSPRYINTTLPAFFDRIFPDHHSASPAGTTNFPDYTDAINLARKTHLHCSDDDVTLLVMRPADPRTSKITQHPTRLPSAGHPRVYVPRDMRPWVLRACHVSASCHLGVHRTLRMVERFYWWVGVDSSVRWWVRSCLVCQARKTSRQTVRWPVLTMPLPNAPGIVVGVDFFGPLPLTARGYSYILLFTDRFSRRADMFAVTAAEFTAKGAANIFVNHYITLWGCPTTLISDNGLQFTSKLSAAVYKLLGINKVTTSSYHPQTNGGTERVNHTMAQMLAVSVNERQNDWDVVLPHIEFAYNNSVSQATGLAPNEVHIGRLPRLPLSLFDHPAVGGHQSLDRDQLAYCNLAVDRQRHAYDLVREYHSLAVSRVERRNSKFVKALNNLPVFEVGNWAWIYNSAATIRQGAKKNTDDLVLKAKFSLSWTGPFKILAVGPAAASDTPDGRPLARRLLYLDLPTDAQGPDSRRRVSILRCKPCRNPYDTDDIPKCLPADLSTYVLHSFDSKSPPFHVTPEDVSAPAGHCDVDHISGHQLVRGRGGFVAVLYETHWIGLLTPSWERESDLERFRRHILLYWSSDACQLRQGNRSYRLSRSLAARRELSRSEGERYLAPGYELISHDSWLRRFSASPLPANAGFWYKAPDGLWWSGKISGHQQAGSYLVRLLDDPGPRLLEIPPDRYSTALDAICGSWCLEKHRQRPFGAQDHRPRSRPAALPTAIPG